MKLDPECSHEAIADATHGITVLFHLNRTVDLSEFRHFSLQMFDLSGKKTTHFFFKQLHFLMENQEIHSYFVKISPAALSGVRFIRGFDLSGKNAIIFFLRFDGGFDLSHVRFIRKSTVAASGCFHQPVSLS